MLDIDQSNIRRLDGGLLLVFRELLRTQRTTDAARRLNLTQSTISHALTRLRTLLDDPLFVRRPHGLEPTAFALELAPRIDALVEDTARLVGSRRSFDAATSTRRLRLAAPEFVTIYIGARLIEAFGVRAPNMSLSIEHASRDSTLASLQRGEFDVALGRLDGLDEMDLAVQPLYEDRYCVLARRDHPVLKGARALTFKRYLTLRHVFAQSRSEVGQRDAAVSAANENLNVVARVPQWLSAIAIAASTDAVATVPQRLAEHYAARFDLRVMDAPFMTTSIRVGLARRVGWNDPAIDWLVSLIEQCVV